MVGSSRNRIFGECTRPRAISRRRRMPPENVRTSASRNLARSTDSSSSSISASRCFGRHAVELRVNQHIFVRGQLRIGRERLRDHAEDVAHAVGIGANVVPGDARRARSRRRERGHHADQRGLARAVGPEQAEDFSLGDAEADVVHGHELAELFRQMVDFDRVHDGYSGRRQSRCKPALLFRWRRQQHRRRHSREQPAARIRHGDLDGESLDVALRAAHVALRGEVVFHALEEHLAFEDVSRRKLHAQRLAELNRVDVALLARRRAPTDGRRPRQPRSASPAPPLRLAWPRARRRCRQSARRFPCSRAAFRPAPAWRAPARAARAWWIAALWRTSTCLRFACATSRAAVWAFTDSSRASTFAWTISRWLRRGRGLAPTLPPYRIASACAANPFDREPAPRAPDRAARCSMSPCALCLSSEASV